MLKKEKIKELEEKIGYEFKKKELIWQALTHSSFSNEQKINKYKNYERLEFLGDAVLELLSSQFFFETYPDMPEGEMTKLRSSMVCELALAYCARDISLGDYLLLGKGEEITGGRTRDSIISDVMEAVIGALYLDGGLSEADAFVKKYILSDLEIKQLFYQGEIQTDDQVVITDLRQKTALEESLKSLDMVGQSIADGMPEDLYPVDMMDAYAHLGSIIGESVGEDLIEEIFGRFCMGK